jgi:hypothetical protein
MKVLRFPFCVRNLLVQNRNGNIFSIDIRSDFGFFGVMQTYLYILLHCEKNNLVPVIRFSGKNYSSEYRNRNWFENYFYGKAALPIQASGSKPSRAIHTSVIRSIHDLGLRDKYNREITVDIANSLLEKYMGINEEILSEVNRFVSEAFCKETLGVHYRGTDKAGEAPRVKWANVKSAVSTFLEQVDTVKTIFLATDEPEFIEYFVALSWPVRVVTYDCAEIYRGGIPTHKTTGDGYQKGKEALITCLLLSRCDYCIKTASYLSAWSKVFNPKLKVMMLNKPDDHASWFPDREIWEHQYALAPDGRPMTADGRKGGSGVIGESPVRA